MQRRGYRMWSVGSSGRGVCGRKEPSSKGHSLMPRILMQETSVAGGGEEGKVEGTVLGCEVREVAEWQAPRGAWKGAEWPAQALPGRTNRSGPGMPWRQKDDSGNVMGSHIPFGVCSRLSFLLIGGVDAILLVALLPFHSMRFCLNLCSFLLPGPGVRVQEPTLRCP